MKNPFLIVFIFAFVVSSLCNGEDNTVFRAKSILKGKLVEARVSRKDLDASPLWMDILKAPPLAPEIAIQKATAIARINLDPKLKMEVEEIKLKRLGPSRYAYIVEINFTPLSGHFDGFLAPLSVVVLMNGKVVEFTDVVDR